MADEIHVNDVGTEFRVTMLDGTSALDVSSASTITFKFFKPSGTVDSQTGSLVNSGTDGLVKYVTTSGDIDEIGTWKLQVYIVIGSNSWHSNITSFKVHRNVS